MSFNTKTEPALITSFVVSALALLAGGGVTWLTADRQGLIVGVVGALLSLVTAAVTRQQVYSPAGNVTAINAAVQSILAPPDAVMTVQPDPAAEAAPAPAKKAVAKKAAPAPAADPAPAAPAVDVAAIQAQIDALQAQLPPA